MNGYKKGDKLSGSQMHQIGYNSPYPVVPVSKQKLEMEAQIQQMKYANKPSDLSKKLFHGYWYSGVPSLQTPINLEAVAKELMKECGGVWGYLPTSINTNEPYKEEEPEEWL